MSIKTAYPLVSEAYLAHEGNRAEEGGDERTRNKDGRRGAAGDVVVRLVLHPSANQRAYDEVNKEAEDDARGEDHCFLPLE